MCKDLVAMLDGMQGCEGVGDEGSMRLRSIKVCFGSNHCESILPIKGVHNGCFLQPNETMDMCRTPMFPFRPGEKKSKGKMRKKSEISNCEQNEKSNKGEEANLHQQSFVWNIF